MSHVFPKKKPKRYLEVRRKTARIHSGSTISAKALLRAMDKKGKVNATKTKHKKFSHME